MTTRGVRLLTYADRLGGDLRRLGDVLDGPLADLVGVHILPFYPPYDGVTRASTRSTTPRSTRGSAPGTTSPRSVRGAR